MRKQEFIKIFGNDIVWNNAMKIDKSIRNTIRTLNNVLAIEIFSKQFANFDNNSDIELNDIRDEFIEINKLFYAKNLVKGCRQTKGFMEDCLSFICQNYDRQAININSGNNPRDFRKYLIKNNDTVFSILNEEISEEYDFLTQIYNYVAKIDHHTSIKVLTKNIERNKRIRNIQYSYCSITSFMIFLLFDFLYTKQKKEIDDDLLFIIKTITTLNSLLSISFIYNYDKQEYLNLITTSNLNNPVDEKYLSDLSEWNKKVTANNQFQISKEDRQFIDELFKTYDDELKSRGYIDIKNEE